jgi:hypothetical protein
MSKTISDIEAALNAAADLELEKLLEPLTKIIEDDRLRGYTNSEVIQSEGAPGVLVKQRTWSNAIVALARDVVMDAVRDDFRKKYVQRWLADVNRTISVVEDLEGRQ